jgi:auxin influx carrier (AUX1 LAX family)
MPLNFMWEKLLGIHEGNYVVRVIARVPIACLLWFLALLVPFFGPLNSLIGAFIMSFSVYIIPCVAYLMVFKHPQSREVYYQCCCEHLRNLILSFLFSRIKLLISIITGSQMTFYINSSNA